MHQLDPKCYKKALILCFDCRQISGRKFVHKLKEKKIKTHPSHSKSNILRYA